jgi:hypothetical protein
MSTPNPIVTAATPSLIAVLQALQAFITNMGTDPATLAIKFPGAVQILLGTVEMQLPLLASSELAAVQTDINSKIGGWISKLKGGV